MRRQTEVSLQQSNTTLIPQKVEEDECTVLDMPCWVGVVLLALILLFGSGILALLLFCYGRKLSHDAQDDAKRERERNALELQELVEERYLHQQRQRQMFALCAGLAPAGHGRSSLLAAPSSASPYPPPGGGAVLMPVPVHPTHLLSGPAVTDPKNDIVIGRSYTPLDRRASAIAKPPQEEEFDDSQRHLDPSYWGWERRQGSAHNGSSFSSSRRTSAAGALTPAAPSLFAPLNLRMSDDHHEHNSDVYDPRRRRVSQQRRASALALAALPAPAPAGDPHNNEAQLDPNYWRWEGEKRRPVSAVASNESHHSHFYHHQEQRGPLSPLQDSHIITGADRQDVHIDGEATVVI